MEKVIKDKIQQSQQDPKKTKNAKKEESDDDFDDFDKEAEEILSKMKEERLKQIKESEQNAKSKQNFWPGEYREIVEEEFLPYVTKNELAICHFYHQDFERCKIIDKHLRIIAPNHSETAFITLNVEKAPFFVQKLQIKVLPTICLFKDGVLKKKVVGFEELGGNDEFKTIELVRMYLNFYIYFEI